MNADIVPLLSILAVVNSFIIIGAIVGFYHRSRLWTGVNQNARLEKVERAHAILDGNHRALDRDVSEFHREMRDTMESLLAEVQKVTQNGAKEHPLEDAIRELREHVTALEVEIAAIPACPALAAAKSHEGVA